MASNRQKAKFAVDLIVECPAGQVLLMMLFTAGQGLMMLLTIAYLDLHDNILEVFALVFSKDDSFDR